MKKTPVQDGTLEQVIQMESSIQKVSNAGFLLSHVKPLNKQQAKYAALLNEESKKLSDIFSQSFLNVESASRTADD